VNIRDWFHRIVGNDTELVVENIGDAVGENAVTGYSGPPPKRGQKVVVENTGNAVATGGGYANSGIDYTDRKGGKR
jgi:hypothetical protein